MRRAKNVQDQVAMCVNTIVWSGGGLTVSRRKRANVGVLSRARGQVDGDTLAGEVSRQIPNKLNLLFDREPTDDGLENRADSHSVFADQTGVIDVGEYAHQESTLSSAKTQVRGVGYQTYWQSIRSVIPPCPGML